MESLNVLLQRLGYRMCMCTTDRRYFSFLQEENYCLNILCFYDERRQTSTRPQMENFLMAHRERFASVQNKDLHFLKIVCTGETGVRTVPPMPDASVPIPDEEGEKPGREWIEDVWYLIDDGISHQWRLFVPGTAVADFYGLKEPLEKHVRANGVAVEIPDLQNSASAAGGGNPGAYGGGTQHRPGEKADPAELCWVSLGLILVNLLLYFLQKAGAVEIEKYAEVYGILQDPSQWYRLLTAMFLHGSLQHLLSNMVVLYAAGSWLEPKIHRGLFGGIYFVSGIAGGVLSCWYHTIQGIDYYGYGASGAVYGLMGAMILHTLMIRNGQDGNFRGTMYRIIIALILLFYQGSGSAGPGSVPGNINHMAHLGGLVTGAFLMAACCLLRSKLVFKSRREES